MAKAKYCPNCKRMVTPTKKFNWIVVIFLCGWLWYLPFYLLKGKKCPICHSKCMSLKKARRRVTPSLEHNKRPKPDDKFPLRHAP